VRSKTLTHNPDWSDKKTSGAFKSYHDVLEDVASAYGALGMQDPSRLNALQDDMKRRPDRRNGFFHSTHLLDLSVTQRLCVEAFCDLFDYGTLLFPEHSAGAVRGARNLETMEILLRLERAAFSDPAIPPKVAGILADWPRNMSNASRKGVHLAVYPEDMHLRLCVICGGQELRDKLRALLLSQPH
jgi:hypothetical protein